MTWQEAYNCTLAEIKESGKLSEVMEYLRAEDDDIAQVFLAVKNAYAYITNAVGGFDEASQTAQALLYSMSEFFYDSRTYMGSSKTTVATKVELMFQSILLQLQMEWNAKHPESVTE